MTRIVFLLLLAAPLLGQSGRLTETEQLQVRVQLLMQENAALRKQVAELQVRLAEALERDVQSGGDVLLKTIADQHGVSLEEYDLQISGKEMRFVKRSKAR